MPAGCRESRRGSDRAPAYRAVQSAQNPAALARLPPAAPRPSAPPTPPARCSGTRAAKTMPTDSATKRRATNPRTCAEARSSHCSSSTKHTRGCSSATSDSRLSTAQPDQETGQVPARNSCRRQSARHHAAAPVNAAGYPAWARTADAMRRRPIPSRTGNPWCALARSSP